MSRFWIILKRDLANLLKSPVLLQFNTLLPILLTLILGFLCQGNYGEDITSYDYYGITMLLFTVISVSVSAANGFMEKSIKACNLRVIYSPIKVSYIYLSKIVATFLYTSVCFMLVIGVCKFFMGVDYGGKNFGYVLLLILLLDLLSAALGVMFCCIFKSEEVSSQILSMANNVMGILGGLFFQLDGLGKAASTISNISPVKWVLVGIMKVIYDGDLSFMIPITIIFLSVTVLLTFICKLTFRTEDYV
ncbi:MAG: potB1 [Eubacterium sp.]|jgi:ABC-2 type transport system permease protein|nr:potB1 [Eubacterium sp.]